MHSFAVWLWCVGGSAAVAYTFAIFFSFRFVSLFEYILVLYILYVCVFIYALFR